MVKSEVGELQENPERRPSESNGLSQTRQTENIVRSSKKRKKEVFEGVFEIGFTVDKEKFAKCKLCEAKDKQERIIKMKDGNTTGITRHFKNYHEVEYNNAFPSTSQSSKELLYFVKLVSTTWNLTSVNLPEDTLIWRFTIWRNRAFLAIPRRRNDIKKKRFTLVEASWPEIESETTFPLLPFPNSHSQLGMDNDCFHFLRCVVALDVDSRDRLWILDVPTEKRCPAKLIVYDLRRNNRELIRIEFKNLPTKNLRALVVDSSTDSSDPRAIIGDPGDESIIVYSLAQQQWWKVKLVHGSDVPKVYSTDLTISRDSSLLYLTGYPSHDLFSIDLEELENSLEDSDTEISSNATVSWHGKKLGSSSGLFCDEKDGLHYFLITERASVRWDTHQELNAENHLVLLQNEEVPYITHYISDSQNNVWGLTNSWFPFRKQDSGNISTVLKSRTIQVFEYN